MSANIVPLAQIATPTIVNADLRKAAKDILSFGWDDKFERLIRCDVINAANSEARAGLAARIEMSLRPMGATAVLSEVSRLHLITISRDADQKTIAAQKALYADALGSYPADVVIDVCRKGGWKFWPALAELVERCEQAVATRRAMLDALRRAPVPRIAEQPRQPPTEEDKAYVQNLLRPLREKLPQLTEEN